jgi:hypothetical protein
LFTQADLGKLMAAKQSISLGQEAWMNVHKNARLTPRRRRELVLRLESGEWARAVASRLDVSLHPRKIEPPGSACARP